MYEFLLLGEAGGGGVMFLLCVYSITSTLYIPHPFLAGLELLVEERARI